jgi:hypothetical protein
VDPSREGFEQGIQNIDDIGNTVDEYVVPKPLRGLMTNHGFCIVDPEVPNRITIWFSGGRLEMADDYDRPIWMEHFDSSSWPDVAQSLATRILLGATVPAMASDGTMSYTLHRPIGGHGKVFCDVVYSDGVLQVTKGHSGTLHVSTKVPSFSLHHHWESDSESADDEDSVYRHLS